MPSPEAMVRYWPTLYPVPLLTIVKPVITPLFTDVISTVAPLPDGTRLTVSPSVYPEPALVISCSGISPFVKSIRLK